MEVGNVSDPERLPRTRNSTYASDAPTAWVEALDIRSSERVWVPYELVHANATVPWPPGSGAFLFGSNGLASGNSHAEAVLHGLFELIERDALAVWKCRSSRAHRRTRIRLDAITGTLNRSLLDQLDDVDIDVIAWNVTSDVGVATLCVLLVDRLSAADFTPYPAAFGAGCHLSRDVALTRALVEAAQSRLVSMAGSRDDMSRAAYGRTQSPEVLASFRHLAAERANAEFTSIPSAPIGTIEDDLARTLGALEAGGLEQVLCVSLAPADAPLSVVRMIVPGLEGPSSSPSYVAGARAQRASRR